MLPDARNAPDSGAPIRGAGVLNFPIQLFPLFSEGTRLHTSVFNGLVRSPMDKENMWTEIFSAYACKNVDPTGVGLRF